MLLKHKIANIGASEKKAEFRTVSIPKKTFFEFQNIYNNKDGTKSKLAQ